MFYLNLTKKFLLFSVNHGGAGFAGYSTAASGHFYYSNNLSDPWGNDKVHIGSFNLKTAGNTFFVIGDSGEAQGTILQGMQKYTNMCNMFSAGTLDLHFLTIVIDRPKPSEYGATTCPGTAAHTFLDNLEHPQVTLTITPYYKDASNSLIAGSNLSTSFWASKDFAGTTTLGLACYSLPANVPNNAAYPDSANFYTDPGKPPLSNAGETNYWSVGNVAMPRHACRAFPPGTTAGSGPGECDPCPGSISYRFYNRNVTATPRCAPTALYAYYNNAHYWANTYSNPYSPNVNSCKVTITSTRHQTGPGVSTYYNNLGPYDSIIGASNGVGGSGIYQCTYLGTGRFSPNSLYNNQEGQAFYGFPRYMPDLAPRCNQGARTNTQDPYYSAGPAGSLRYGGYGFYMKFAWDALCYPCA